MQTTRRNYLPMEPMGMYLTMNNNYNFPHQSAMEESNSLWSSEPIETLWNILQGNPKP